MFSHIFFTLREVAIKCAEYFLKILKFKNYLISHINMNSLAPGVVELCNLRAFGATQDAYNLFF